MAKIRGKRGRFSALNLVRFAHSFIALMLLIESCLMSRYLGNGQENTKYTDFRDIWLIKVVYSSKILITSTRYKVNIHVFVVLLWVI